MAAERGQKTDKNPTDKGKPGTKHHLLVDRQGVSLAAMLTGANTPGLSVFEELVDAVEPIKRPGRDRPRKQPEKLHADKAYDSALRAAGRHTRGGVFAPRVLPHLPQLLGKNVGSQRYCALEGRTTPEAAYRRALVPGSPTCGALANAFMLR